MYLESTNNILPGQRVKIKYDCDGGFERCGKECEVMLKVSEKNAQAHNGKHICRQCQLRANNPAKRPEVRKKMTQTTLERYGTANVMNTEENIAKRKEKFKDQNFVQQRTAKSRKTSLKKYGAEHVMHLDEFKEKQKASMQEKYGVDHPYQSAEIMAKMQAKNKERYGVENVAQLPETQVKMAKTTLEKYGVEHYNELPEMKDYLRENCREWLAESWANSWAKGITRPEEWNKKQSETMTQKILRGEFNPEDSRFYVTGYYICKKCKKSKAFFRSSLELMMHYLLDNDENVIWYENEPFSILYEKAPGVTRNYIPDFFVFRKDCKPLLLEIKPAFRMRETEVGYKIRAGEAFCQANGFEFVYIDEHFLKEHSLPLDELRLLEHIEIINNK